MTDVEGRADLQFSFKCRSQNDHHVGFCWILMDLGSWGSCCSINFDVNFMVDTSILRDLWWILF